MKPLKFLLVLVALFYLASFAQAQTTPSTAKATCPCGVACECVGCDCTIALVSVKAVDYSTADADAAAALALALSSVASVPESVSNYASMHTLALGAKTNLVIGVDCTPPKGDYLTARTTQDDPPTQKVKGAYILVAFYKGGELKAFPDLALPATATQQDIDLALAKTLALSQPQPQAQQQVYYMGGGCANGQCGMGGMMMGGCAGGSCFGGGCAGGRCR